MENIIFEKENGIAIVKINRPKQLNALNETTLNELNEVLDTVKKDREFKGMILTGSGEKAFVAGADITELAEIDGTEGYHFARLGQRVFNRIERMRIPVIAYINGFALGGGLELAMACHIRIASENAKMGQPESKLGLIPGYGGTQRLPRIIGQGRALDLLLTGKMIDANTAREYGLVVEVVSQEEGLRRAAEYLELISSNGPLATANILSAVTKGMQMPLDQALDYEASLFGVCCSSEEKNEGTAAFLEKRSPKFKR